MSSNGQDNHQIEEKQPSEYLLEHLLETIQVQLEYAKKMDADKLKGLQTEAGFTVSVELEIINAQTIT